MHQRRVARSIARYEPWDRTGIYGGHEMTVHIADPLSEGWYGQDSPPIPEIAMLLELDAIRPGGCIYDLGAHQGVIALMLGREVGPDGYVLAVEAEPHNARVAARNVLANGARNVTVLHAAIAEQDGSLFFSESLNGSVTSSRTGSVEVPAWTVDTLMLTHRPPDVVFMDIEGYEGRALPAAVRTIGTGATFFVEVHVETLVDATAEHLVRLFRGRDIYIGPNPTGDACDFAPYDGGPLPTDRFFLIAHTQPPA